MTKILIHKETGSVFQFIEGTVWGHPLYAAEDQLLDLNPETAPEWCAIDMSVTDDFLHEGKEIPAMEFAKIISAKLSQ